MKQMEVESFTLLLSHTWPASPLCSQEEANTYLLLHVAGAVQKRCNKVTVPTLDTNMVVLAEASLSKIIPGELWVAFWLPSMCQVQLSVHSCSQNGCHCEHKKVSVLLALHVSLDVTLSLLSLADPTHPPYFQ